MQTVDSSPLQLSHDYWPKGIAGQVATRLCGIIAVLVAIKAAAYQPSETPVFAQQAQFVRILAFAALTIWTALAIGLRRRGAAAIITLGFALFVELFLVQMRTEGLPMIASANLGIVVAYCGLQLYWLGLVQKRDRQTTAREAI